MNNTYSGFAYLYDKLMSDVDYDLWINYIEKIFKAYKIKPKTIVELACGTANITTRLAQKGYDMIGIDISPDMLSVAKDKAIEQDIDILYLNQDMTSFELDGKTDVFLCFMDSINYILNKKDLLNTFKLVKKYLKKGGIFVFDINTDYKIKNILANNTFVVDEDNIFYVWENEYNSSKKICNFYLTFFCKDNNKYSRIDEIHQERAYTDLDIRTIVKNSGLLVDAVYEQFTFKIPSKCSERNFYIVKDCDFIGSI